MNLNHPSVSLLDIPKSLAGPLLWAVPLHVIGSLTILLFSAGVYVRAVGDQGPWWIGGWSLVVLYTIAAVAGGVAAGILSAAHRWLDTLESVLHAGLNRLPPFTQDPDREALSPDEARLHYAALVDRLLNPILGHVPLPGWLRRKLRSWIQDAIVTDFIGLCRQRNLARIPRHEFRNWILTKGATLALVPLHDQVSLWQYVIFGLLGLLAGGALLLSYLAS
ncbi:MAG TPA: hypothetical protein VHF07_04135 [Nitrospiraceae bacterium]|nr:hypothetical protein [Nitrospiraceae bacterium]